MDSEEEFECRAPVDESHLEGCYVLHEAAKVSASKSKKCRKKETLPSCLEDEPDVCGEWRRAAFTTIWNNIEGVVKEALENKNKECFNSIHAWIRNTQFCNAQRNLYMSPNRNITNAKLSATLLFSGAVDASDSCSMFNALTEYLKKENSCRVARLQPDLLVGRNSVNAPLRSLFKQFTGLTPETTDMEILAAWHRQAGEKMKPLVVLVEDAEHSSSSLLSALIVVLSEWAGELPLVVILGMATIGESLGMLLPASVMDRLQLQCFSLATPLERLDAVIDAVLADCPFVFCWSSAVLKFLYESFHTHNNTITSFLRLLKISCMEHFSKQPLSFLCLKLLEYANQADFEEICSKLPSSLIQYAATLSSCESHTEGISKSLARALWQYRNTRRRWSMSFQCFLAAGKHMDFLFSEVLYGALTCTKSSACDTLLQIVERMRHLPLLSFSKLSEEWTNFTLNDPQCCRELELLQKHLADASYNETGSPLTRTFNRTPSKMTRRIKTLMGCNTSANGSPGWARPSSCDQKAALVRLACEFLQRLQREYMISPESIPFHEVFCFKNVDALKKALTGETRKLVHYDLLFPRTSLKCQCCPTDGSLSPSLHDTCMMYILSQEHNELINVHDWYQSFEMIQNQDQNTSEKGSTKRHKRKAKAPSNDEDSSSTKARNQAAFCKAVAELHVTGLLRLPKKRQPDSVQRIAFGL